MRSGRVDDNLSDVLERYTGRNESTADDDSEEHEKDISQLELQNSGSQSDFFSHNKWKPEEPKCE